MSIFNPETFLKTTFDKTPDTQRVPCPEGIYVGRVDKLLPPRRPKPDMSFILTVVWEIMDDAVCQEIGRDKVTSRQDLWLDLTDDGALDLSKGKNVDLGRLLEALDITDQPWTPEGMVGLTGGVKISHRVDKDKPEDIFDYVAKVVSIQDLQEAA